MSSPIPGDPLPSRPSRLNGWKEIAAYLQRGVRTVQRWEKTLGLPVRRMGTGRGEVVYALAEELDAWLEAAERTRDLSERPEERDGENGAAAGIALAEDHAAGTAESRPPTSGTDSEQPGPVPGEPPADPAPAPAAARAPARRRWWMAAAALLAVGVLAAGSIAWRVSGQPAGQPADYVVDVDTFRVLDGRGRELWSDRFDAPISPDSYARWHRRLHRDPVHFEDLDGDGRREVVFGYTPVRRDQPAEFRAYSESGRLLFSTRLTATVRFGDTTYSPPWNAYRVWVTDGPPGGGRWLWVAWVHTQGEFPCLLQRLALDGSVQAEIWTAGYVETVITPTVAGVPSLVVGGANNDHAGAGLALFDRDVTTATMPAETWDKTCRTCPPGQPKKVLVFPRMDVAELFGSLPSAVDVIQQETGEFRVYVDHGALGEFDPPRGGLVAYDLSPDFTPVLAEFNASYLSAHDLHYAKGLLDHPFNDADRAAAWPVLVWENGVWTKVTGRTDR